MSFEFVGLEAFLGSYLNQWVFQFIMQILGISAEWC